MCVRCVCMGWLCRAVVCMGWLCRAVAGLVELPGILNEGPAVLNCGIVFGQPRARAHTQGALRGTDGTHGILARWDRSEGLSLPILRE